MGSTRTAATLGVDFPTDPGNLARTIFLVDGLITRGELAGQGAAQALDAIGVSMDAFAEPAPAAPAASFTGTAGPATYHYAAVREYPIPQSVPGAPQIPFVGGASLAGTGALQSGRTKRYSAMSAVTAVANAAAALGPDNYVTVTAPNADTTFSSVTYAIVRTGPDAIAASGHFFLTGYAPGTTYAVAVGGIAAGVTAEGDLPATATALAAAIAAANPAVKANAMTYGSYAVITITAVALGVAGNVIELSATSPTPWNAAGQYVEGMQAGPGISTSGGVLTGGMTGAILGTVATGVAPGATVRDSGALINGATSLPAHAEVVILPDVAAGAVINLVDYAVGQTYSATIGNAATATVTGAVSAAATATALATAIAGATGAVVTASANGSAITLESTATGALGNGTRCELTWGTGAGSLVGPHTLAGGITSGPLFGPRTHVSGPAGF